MRRLQCKRGISPIIGVAALLMLVTALAGTIYWFASDLIPEQILLSGDPVELLCPQVELDIGIFGTELDVLNKGAVPLHGGVLKVTSVGSTIPYELILDLEPGQSTSVDISTITMPLEATLSFSPILQGQTTSGVTQTFTCPQEIPVEIF